jgi:DNA-binding beta-propeller fold protein YncE
VSDGYGNARVHKYSPDGKLMMSWGKPGIGPGEFQIPHNICCDEAGFVYVADRENHRIQVFDGNGRFETQWHGLHRPCAMCLAQGRMFVAEIGPELAVNKDWTNLGPRISIVDMRGEVLARLGDDKRGPGPTQFVAPHGIAVDRHGDIYLAELPNMAWPRFFDAPPPHPLTVIRKLRRL